eukprot:TRINITY_DN6752_c0_g1_i8.p2 TRINITY_DN6752_c0_g1~~TRINITY_DN6752_c0_g1_i8.p2  ORF type:complete len:107 (-),score=6.69 TRINITY_DN6752_c0_g1_i8:213-533(-)
MNCNAFTNVVICKHVDRRMGSEGNTTSCLPRTLRVFLPAEATAGKSSGSGFLQAPGSRREDSSESIMQMSLETALTCSDLIYSLWANPLEDRVASAAPNVSSHCNG